MKKFEEVSEKITAVDLRDNWTNELEVGEKGKVSRKKCNRERLKES